MKKIALITGASAGLGAEFARQVDSYGLDELWLVARRESRLKELSETLTTPCKILVCDLANPLDVDEVLGITLTDESPHISYCFNNAGFGKVGPFSDLSHDDQLGMVDLNCRALVDVAHRALRYMSKGSILINTSSTAGFGPLGAFAVYGATKAFVTSLSVALQAELIDLGIHVIAVCPGPTETEFSKVAHKGSLRNDSVFTKKATAKAVVQKALQDAHRHKTFSIYGFKFQVLSFIVKFLPQRLIAQKSYDKVMATPQD